MARVELTQAALEDLERLIYTHSLPADTKERIKRSLRPLEDFPYIGAPLAGRWEGCSRGAGKGSGSCSDRGGGC